MAIDVKTTGMLLDELITFNLKLLGPKATIEVVTKHDKLVDVLLERHPDKASLLIKLVRLAVIDSLCFFAQDEIMNESNSTEDVAFYAKQAQRFNGLRNAAIRQIDEIFGEDDSPTEKTYGAK